MGNKDDLAAMPGLLERLQPGFLPQAVFHPVARFVVTPPFVVIPLSHSDEKTSVYLVRRDVDDPNYANLLHTPGTVILATDESLTETYGRLAQTDLRGL